MRQAGTAAGIWRKLRRGAGLVGCLLAASCAGSGGLDFGGQQPAGPVQTFETVGSGSVKVALLLPMSAGGS